MLPETKASLEETGFQLPGEVRSLKRPSKRLLGGFYEPLHGESGCE